MIYKRSFIIISYSFKYLFKRQVVRNLHLAISNNTVVFIPQEKPKLTTMKLSEEQMKKILQPGVVKLNDIFMRNNYEIRIAGGAVRDLLMGKFPKDLDFATTATPNEMKDMFEKEEIRMINMGGEKHGTITAHIDEENFECTTLRIDRSHDGRHADVEFIKNWELDAGRRDLTINALYLGLDGIVYDYYDGINHLNKRIVTFVGDPKQRITEDYLRILRYFRFYGIISDHPDKHDTQIIEVIKNNCNGLGKISGERIWIEIKKILVSNYGGELISKMLECGIGPYTGLSSDYNCSELIGTYVRLKNADINISNVNPSTLIAAGFTNESDVLKFIERVKCSKKEKDIILYIGKEKKYLAQLSPKIVTDLLLDLIYVEKRTQQHSIFVVSELIKYVGRVELLNELKIESIPKFPIKGGMLIDKVKDRRQIGKYVNDLFIMWKHSDYTLTSDQLLEKLNQ